MSPKAAATRPRNAITVDAPQRAHSVPAGRRVGAAISIAANPTISTTVMPRRCKPVPWNSGPAREPW